MLSERASYLLAELNMSSSEAAHYAGLKRAAFTHLKNGTREYSRSSKTVRSFIEGVCACAEDSGKTDLLCLLIGCGRYSREEVSAGLNDWLFSESSTLETGIADTPQLFGKKLSSAMELADVSGSKLSRELNIDASYISRMRSGERIPKKNDQLVKQMCSVLAGKIIDNRREGQLAVLLGIPAEYITEDEAAGQIYSWLCDRTVTDDISTVRAFIRIVEALPDSMIFPPDEQSELREEAVPEADEYIGDTGLREAVVRLLSNAASHRSSQLLLYSDMSMDWMEKDSFGAEWASLMNRCVHSGVKMKIIHNIDRSASELITAICSWLPIYLSGMVESYYSTKKQGERFCHTFFLDPGYACIEGSCVPGMEDEAEYAYITASGKLEKRERAFGLLMGGAKPLISFSRSFWNTSGIYSIYDLGQVQLCIGRRDVIVNKISGQIMSFRITHPIMCRAFRSFAERLAGDCEEGGADV